MQPLHIPGPIPALRKRMKAMLLRRDAERARKKSESMKQYHKANRQ